MIQAELRLFRALALALLTIAAALAPMGCKDSGGTSGGGQSADGKSAAGEPIIVMIPADVVTLDPPRPTDGNSLMVVRHVFDTLVDFHETELKPVPGLAESWEVSDDGLRYTFQLREDATFSDGTPVTAEDVKFTFDRLTDTSHPQHYPGIKWTTDILAPEWYVRTEVAGERTAVVVLSRPYVPLLLNLAIPASAIVSKAYTIEAGDEGTSVRPMGSGPYVLDEWRQGAYVKLSARENHWRGKPANPGLIFQPQNDASQTVSAMKRGDAHFASVVSPIAMGGKDKDLGESELIEVPLPSIGYIIFNTTKPNLRDKRVRQAINYAIDRQSICDDLLVGTSIPAPGILPPAMLGYREEKPFAYTYDPEKAKALLKEAGFGPENPVKFTFHTFDAIRPYNVVGSRLAQRIQEDLRKVGVETEIKLMEFGGLIEMLEERTIHELATIGWMSDNGDPDNFIYYLFGSPSNRANYDNLEARELMEKAQGEQDEAARAAMYQKAEELVVADPPALFINHATAFRAQSKRLRGFKAHPLVESFWNCHLE